MNEPMTMPYSSKYWEDSPYLARWFIFGEGVNTADISDGNADVFTKIPISHAERICQARDKFVDEIENINRELGGNRRMF